MNPRSLLLSLLVAGGIATTFAIAEAPAEPVHVFNGRDLTGWTWHSPTATSKIDDTWSVNDGALHSGTKPTGYLQTDKTYDNFTLTVEYRHLTNANGGIFICINGGIGNGKTWPDALQIQGKFGAVGELINQNTGMKAMRTDPARTRTLNKDVVVSRLVTDAEKPLKEWNTMVIKVDHGKLDVTLNDKLVNTAEGLEPASGPIGIQAEGAEMEFRKFDLMPIE